MEQASTSSQLEPRIESLVLDAGPLVTQAPLKGLAKKYYIPRSVVDELKDKRARDHLAWLQSEAGGCEVEVMEPGPAAMVAVTAFAKKTGDYSVLSRPDMTVLALTYSLEFQKHGTWRIREEVGGKTGQQMHTLAQQAEKKKMQEGSSSLPSPSKDTTKPKKEKKEKKEEIPDMSTIQLDGKGPAAMSSKETIPSMAFHASEDSNNTPVILVAEHASNEAASPPDLEDDEDDEETGGEWITPENITKHKNRALGLVTDEDMPLSSVPTSTFASSRWRTQIAEADDGWSTVISAKKSGDGEEGQARHNANTQAAKKQQQQQQQKMTVACMTGDYAVQNVLLQMGLSLVGLEGQKIKQVRSWVLRCHACFKICKDADKKFCPQCGNPTLMRTSVTSSAPDAKGGDGFKVHLKKNFQYRNRGTIYSLPLPKPGKAGGAAQSVPILREDQPEWQKAVNAEKIKRRKEEKALQKALERGSDSLSARYEDADELSMLLAGGSGKNRSNVPMGLPSPGIGRKNPNERRRRQV